MRVQVDHTVLSLFGGEWRGAVKPLKEGSSAVGVLFLRILKCVVGVDQSVVVSVQNLLVLPLKEVLPVNPLLLRP